MATRYVTRRVPALDRLYNQYLRFWVPGASPSRPGLFQGSLRNAGPWERIIILCDREISFKFVGTTIKAKLGSLPVVLTEAGMFVEGKPVEGPLDARQLAIEFSGGVLTIERDGDARRIR